MLAARAREGVVLRGCATTDHAKQLAQQAVMEAISAPIRANEIWCSNWAELRETLGDDALIHVRERRIAMRPALMTLAILGLATDLALVQADDIAGKQATAGAAASPDRTGLPGSGDRARSCGRVQPIVRHRSDGTGCSRCEYAQGLPGLESGLRRYDILLSYDDQRLHAPEQLIKLVRSDTPGRKVKMRLVRAGRRKRTRSHWVNAAPP